jgi:protein-S-isoprenylcysteine O-methyltransferase Ste14
MSLDPLPGAPSTPAATWHGRRGELLVAAQFALVLAFVMVPVWNPWLTPDLMAATVQTRWVALLILGVLGVAFGVLGSLGIRRYLTPLPYPVDHSRLVTSGVYGVIRHPLYSSQLFVGLGWVFYSLSLSHLGLLILGFLFFDFKAAKEEGWLTERHPEYARYALRVRKFVPWVY